MQKFSLRFQVKTQVVLILFLKFRHVYREVFFTLLKDLLIFLISDKGRDSEITLVNSLILLNLSSNLWKEELLISIKKGSLMLRYGVLGLLCLLPFSSMNCDNTVALDTTLPQLTDVYVSGVCPTGANGGVDEFELSLVLLNQGNLGTESDNLLPESRVKKQRQNVGEFFENTAIDNLISFNKPARANMDAPNITTNSYIQDAVDGGPGVGSALKPRRISFEYTGEGVDDERDHLVLMLLDQSGSLVGKIPNMPPDPTKATDFTNQRITFFKQFVQNLPENYAISLITFNDRFTDYISKNDIINNPDSTSQPLLNRDVIEDELDSLTSAMRREGGTPLKEVMKDALSFVNEYKNDYRISILLFTDGLDDLGDTSPSSDVDILNLGQEFAQAKVPVHVLDLQPPPTVDPQFRGRDIELSQLSCLTGGDYLFVKSASDFTNSKRLSPILRNRIVGRWILKTDTDLNDNQIAPADAEYLLSTDLKVNVGSVSVVDSLTLSSASSGQSDNRIWFYKY